MDNVGNAATLIDYGDVGDGPASLDPITLELSFLFHPDGLDNVEWPSLAQAQQWSNLEVYLADCPISSTISLCREWAKRTAAGKREIVATAYAYLLRQLKYEETNKELILALLTGVRNSYQ